MDTIWYIKKGSSIYGPSSKNDIETLLLSNRISGTDEISTTQSGPWQSISSHEDFKIQVTPLSHLMEGTSAHVERTAEKAVTYNTNQRLPTDQECEKYLNELSARGGEWIGFLTFAICVALFQYFLGDSPACLRSALFIVSIGAGIFSFQRWKMYRRDTLLAQIESFRQPERELESRYNRFIGRKIVWNIFTWSIIIAVFVLAGLYRHNI